MCVLHLKNTVKGSLGSGDKRQNFHKRIIKTSLTPGEFIENIQLFKKNDDCTIYNIELYTEQNKEMYNK